jgi:hypothetical protein
MRSEPQKSAKSQKTSFVIFALFVATLPSLMAFCCYLGSSTPSFCSESYYSESAQRSGSSIQNRERVLVPPPLAIPYESILKSPANPHSLIRNRERVVVVPPPLAIRYESIL